MSDAFFEKLFGDSQPGEFGTGWISGTASVFLGCSASVARCVCISPGCSPCPTRARSIR